MTIIYNTVAIHFKGAHQYLLQVSKLAFASMCEYDSRWSVRTAEKRLGRDAGSRAPTNEDQTFNDPFCPLVRANQCTNAIDQWSPLVFPPLMVEL